MRAVVQRVSSASVTVDGDIVGAIDTGLLVLVGIGRGDGPEEVAAVTDKLAGLRVFRDDEGKMNRSLVDAGASVLLVSQFTLLGDVRKGRRPSFTAAAPPALAEPLVDLIADRLRERGIPVETGVFGAMMDVALVNDGPVTLVIDVADGSIR